VCINCCHFNFQTHALTELDRPQVLFFLSHQTKEEEAKEAK